MHESLLTTSQSAARVPAMARGRMIAALAILGALAVALALVNLPYAPALWFDEGSHMQVPRTLITHGVYADISSEGFRYFGPTIGVGPTVMLPVAAAFQLFGVAPVVARLVIVAYLGLALVAAALLARRLHGLAAAPLTLALLLASRTAGFDGMVEYGRQVLGEVPGAAFLLVGALLWGKAVRADGGRRAAWSALSGLAFGLALITKNQFALIVGPGLALIALLDLVYYRQGSWALRLLPGLIAAACFTAWTVAMLTLLGPSTFAENLALTRQAARGAIFVFDGAATLRALRYIVQPYGGLLLPAIAYGLWRCRARGAAALAELPLVLLPALWLGWYLTSLGWPRYAFPAVALAAPAVARLLLDALAWLRARPRWSGAAGLLAVYTALAVAAPLALSIQTILSPSDSAYRMADYLRRHVPQDLIVETWEPELGALAGHRFHFPPTELLDGAVRDRWLAGPAPSYPLPADPPPYLVLGSFGRYSGIYRPWVIGPDAPYTHLIDIGPYALYKLRPVD